MSEPVLAATAWPTNADMIVDMHRLGYLRDDDMVIDPTYGRGLWWTQWRPKALTCHDLAEDGVDFRDLPYEDGVFDAAAYDPPYISPGGRSTTGIPDMFDRYGLTDAPTSPARTQMLIDAGLAEVARVVRPKGLILAKCQSYISSGKLWLGDYHTITAGLAIGLTLYDRLEHISGVRPQPPGRRQMHARRNHSTLLVFQRPATLISDG